MVGVRIFFPKLLETEVFPPAHNDVRFFLPALYTMRDFFTEGIFSPGISLQNFFPLKSVCTIFFSEITHTPLPPPLKSQMVGRPLNIPGIGIQNVIEVQKKNCSLLLDVNRSSQRTFKVRKSCVRQNSFLLPPLFILCGHSLMDP